MRVVERAGPELNQWLSVVAMDPHLRKATPLQYFIARANFKQSFPPCRPLKPTCCQKHLVTA